MNIDKAKKIHIVGIGGIGISALARVLEAQGAVVSGSDLETGGHKAENVPTDADLLIYSAAVPENNSERARARELGIKTISYPEALGEFCSGKKVIAVAGTNGKTTTTAMIGWILEQAGMDPTVVVGSKVLAWDANARVGQGQWVVLEADEYRRAFLNYQPDIAVITNIAADHLDYYKDIEDIKGAFAEFVGNIKPGGTFVYNMDDENTRELPPSPSLSKEGESPFLLQREGRGEFGVIEMVGFSSGNNFKLQIPGRYNQSNAAAGATVCRILGIPQTIVASALESFSGTSRRFEKVGRLGRTEIISDYAHHPDAVRVTMQTARELYGGKVLAVFQPHQHNRTKKLFHEFVRAFCSSTVENFIICEIFDVAGREDLGDQDISSQDLVREIQKCGKHASYAKDLSDCETQIRAIAAKFDAIIIMGAGDIYKVASKLVSSKQ